MVWLLALIASLQVAFGGRALLRMGVPLRGSRVDRNDSPQSGSVSLIIPVLNERARLPALLNEAVAQPSEVAQILVVDGGSDDGTQDLVASFSRRDSRVRLVDASPVPSSATGKAWGLARGLAAASSAWVLTLDADTRIDPALSRSLLAHATREHTEAFSIATRQEVRGALQAALHPAMLTTLVYRFGRPGGRTSRPDRVQANGQCFFAKRELLRASGAVDAALDSLCEDVTIARHLARSGTAVGFYEADDLVRVAMYPNAVEAWRNWTRSLPMRDRYSGAGAYLGMAEVLLLMGMPLPALTAALVAGGPAWFAAVQAALVAARVGVLAGTARAYVRRPFSYWLSPLFDLPVALRLLQRLFQRRYEWRGRRYIRRRDGGFELETGIPGGKL